MLHKILHNLNALIETYASLFDGFPLVLNKESVKQLYMQEWKISVLYQHLDTMKLWLPLVYSYPLQSK